MTAKQLLWFGNKYAYEDDFSEVLEQINTELSDTAVSLETHFKGRERRYRKLYTKRNRLQRLQLQARKRRA